MVFSNSSEHFTKDKIYARLKRSLAIFDQKFCLKILFLLQAMNIK